MIPRYTLPEMAALWSEESKFSCWLRVELAACEAWNRLGVIPAATLKRIRSKAAFKISRILKIEQRTRHDLVAFVTAVGESLGADAKYIHYGLTSSDVIDTANALLLREAGKLIVARLDDLRRIIRRQARKYRNLPQIGRTHGIHAEPTTLGLKFALWYDELGRDLRRLHQAIETISVGKISGAVGTYGNLDPRVESIVCRKLHLKPAPISTQINSRDRYAEFLWALAITAATLEKIALELRHLQRTEVREAEEGFAKGQTGSSAMPHKKNPISAENVCGLARIIRANLMVALENVPLWHERDISHSSAERIILPDSTTALHYLICKMSDILENLVVYRSSLQKNLLLTGGLWASGRVLLALTDRLGSREKAYRIVQKAAHQAFGVKGSFREALLKDAEVCRVFSRAELERFFDVRSYLGHVNLIFRRVFK